MKSSKPLRIAGYLSLAVASYFLYFVLIFAGGQLLAAAFQQQGAPIDYNLMELLMDGFMALAFGALFYFFMQKGGRSRRGESDVRLPSGCGFALSAILGLGVCGVSFIWLLFANHVLGNVEFIKQGLELMDKNSTSMAGNPLFYALTVCLVGPIMEELLFRGMIFGSLERITKAAWVPIVVSSLAFGVWHGIFVQGVYTFIMGLVAAFVYHKTHDLRWPIVIHAVNNSFSMLMFVPSIDKLGIIPDVFTVVMIVPAAYVLIKTFASKTNEARLAREEAPVHAA